MNNKTFLIISAIFFSGCSFNSSNYDPFNPNNEISYEQPESSLEININENLTISETEIDSITDLSADGISYDNTNKTFTISKAGEFVFTGEFNGNIVVNAGDKDDVKLTLNNFKIQSSTNSPIWCINANELQVSVKKETNNYVCDMREIKTVDNDDQGNGAITSNTDMKLSGQGSLVIVADYNNGIHCKDDLKISPTVNNNSSIQIKSVNNCLKGNDSLKIESGNLVLISTSGNALKTENTDVSSKGKQRGTISITGGHLDIYSAKDAIEASYNVEISKGDEVPVLNIYTSKFSEYTSDTVSVSTSKMYLKTMSVVRDSYFGVEFMDQSFNVSWVKATKITSYLARSNYYEINKPASATSFKVCLFDNNITTMSEDNAKLKMENFGTINSLYDTVSITLQDESISLNNWTMYQQNGGNQPGGGMGMDEGNDDKADYSAKGIKAENEIKLDSGTYFIKAYDDGIHCNYGTVFDNGSSGLGNITISGGKYIIYASDDGIHADNTLSITGGSIDIKNSYEGLEANIVNFGGGYTNIYATDDGINAAKKSNQTPSITISGGILDVTVNGQDVDGIDSNGTFTQTGGIVITKGATGRMSTGLDCDGSATITGGTFIAFGATEKTLSKGSGIIYYTLSIKGSGNFTVTLPDGTTLQTETKYSHNTVYVYSDNSNKITITK